MRASLAHVSTCAGQSTAGSFRQLGKITDVITQSTPRLFKKFNFRIVWSDGSKGPANLAVSNYGYGADARGTTALVGHLDGFRLAKA